MRHDAKRIERTTWQRWTGGLLFVLLLAGCDGTPLDTAAGGSEADAVAVQEVWGLLASTAELEVRALNRLETTPASGEAAAAIFDAGELSFQAEEARSFGADGEATTLDDTVQSLLTRGLMISLGTEVAHVTLEQTDTALERLRTSLSGRGNPETLAVLAEAERELAAARSARGSGDVGATLMASARASEHARTLDPEARAQAAVAAAKELLEKAQGLAGDSPAPGIARALEKAEQHCANARQALDAGRWSVAVRQARVCARLARAVIARLSAGVDDDAVAERAEQAVAHAGDILERALEAAGDHPRPRIRDLLNQADTLLDQARRALNEERFREAIRLAAASRARSLRVLRLLEGQGTDSR